jgi:hypothetical protein
MHLFGESIRLLPTQPPTLHVEIGTATFSSCVHAHRKTPKNRLWEELANGQGQGDDSICRKGFIMRLMSSYEDCSRSRRRAANGSKRMYLDYTHGLFIT